MSKNYKTTLGGALSAFGKTLMGVGIVPQLSGAHSTVLTYVAMTGFICDAAGGFFGHLFSADAETVNNLIAQVQSNTDILSQKKP